MFQLPNSETLIFTIDIKYKNEIAKPYINNTENIELKKIKNLLDDGKYQKHWDKFKKLTNPYEFIFISKKKHTNKGISKYIPFSRSYFKLWEILKKFQLIDHLHHKNIKTAHIAEGPGGFMECLVNYRNIYKHDNNKNNVFGITLKSMNKNIPGWIKAKRFIKKNDITISYGKDNTGNIYNIENILYFANVIGKDKCDFITSDGGFDFSVDYNTQEQQAYRLLFCELVMAFSIQKIGGTQIIKIFDTFTPLTIKLLYLVSTLYNNVYIYKPLTSRPANSEKYIIAKGFKGIDSNYLKSLYSIVAKWEDIKKNGYSIIDLFKEEIPKTFESAIETFNKEFVKKQISFMKKTLYLIDNKPDVKTYNHIIQSLIQNATEWCNQYDITVNDRIR